MNSHSEMLLQRTFCNTRRAFARAKVEKRHKSAAETTAAAKKRLGLALPVLNSLVRGDGSAKRESKAVSEVDADDVEHKLIQLVKGCREEKILFLGLDISSRVSGYGMLDSKGQGVSCSAIKTVSTDVIDIGNEINSFLSSNIDPIIYGYKKMGRAAQDFKDYELNIIFEDCMTSFSPGKFNARGLMKLAQVNGVARYSTWRHFGIRPALIHPTAARGFFQLLRAKKGEEKKVKKRVFNYVTQYAPDLPWLDCGKEVAYDMTDAYLVAMYARAMHVKHCIVSDVDLWTDLGVHPSILKGDGGRAAYGKPAMELLDKAVQEWLKSRRGDLGLGLSDEEHSAAVQEV